MDDRPLFRAGLHSANVPQRSRISPFAGSYVSKERRQPYPSAMKTLFVRNIDSRGRLVRGAMAVAFFVGAAFLFRHNAAIAAALAFSGAFVLFEALRGWCAFRACGIKTKL
jgi:hypothetical protein